MTLYSCALVRLCAFLLLSDVVFFRDEGGFFLPFPTVPATIFPIVSDYKQMRIMETTDGGRQQVVSWEMSVRGIRANGTRGGYNDVE